MSDLKCCYGLSTLVNYYAEKWFDDGKLVMANRDFHSYTGTFRGLPISMISTGLGGPGDE